MTPCEPGDAFFDRLLEAGSGEPAGAVRTDDALRQAVFDRSARVLCRRRAVRRFGWVAALAACYAAGLATARFGPSSAIGSASVAAVSPGATGAASAPAAPSRPRNYVRVISDGPAENPAKPPVKRPSRFVWLCRTSDRYLAQGDVTAAIGYYRKALAVATDEELAIATDRDSWLLIALKHERLQEKKDESRKT
jgi:hypothetical protein